MAVILSAWMTTLNKELDVPVALEGVEGLEWMLTNLPDAALLDKRIVAGILQYMELILLKKVFFVLGLCPFSEA